MAAALAVGVCSAAGATFAVEAGVAAVAASSPAGLRDRFLGSRGPRPLGSLLKLMPSATVFSLRESDKGTGVAARALRER